MELAEVTTETIRTQTDSHVIGTYVRKLAIVRGEGMRLWDADGREYLDFFAGIAVCNLGHCHPAVTQAISEQAARLVHVSNLYYMEPQAELAALLCKHTFADRWFFCNSGAEANEAAIKLARRYWSQKGTPKPGLITAKASFHGRTLATLTATGQPKLQEGFEPLLPGVKYVEYDDLASLESAIDETTGAVMLEPIQGEGGVRVPSDDYFKGVRELCDRNEVLLILDEVQTGLGRTGTMLAHTQLGMTPDIVTLAKGLGNGVPIGAMGCTEEAASGFGPGTHASTFGGNPLCAAAAVATLNTLLEPGFIERAAQVGEYLFDRLRQLAAKHDCIVEIRGRGLMVGIELTKSVVPLLDAMLEAGVICGPAGPKVLRFLPPLIVTESQVDHVIERLDTALGTF